MKIVIIGNFPDAAKEQIKNRFGSSAFISTSPACRTLVWPPKGVFRIGRTWLS